MKKKFYSKLNQVFACLAILVFSNLPTLKADAQCSTTTFSYTGPAVAIPDNNATGVSIIVPVAGLSGVITDVNFRLDASGVGTCDATAGDVDASIDHTFLADLDFFLTSPAATTVAFMNDNGGGGNNFCTLLIDDDGGFPSVTTIPTTGGVSGNYAPELPLSAFDGQNPNGNWTLKVADDAAGDIGSVRRFSIIITTCVPTPNLIAGTATVTADDCNNNGSIDPEEMITVDLQIANTGTATTTDLVATLQATSNVLSPSGPQNYGTIANPAGTTTRSFSFTANDFSCGIIFPITLQLQDGATDHGTITYNIPTGSLVPHSYSSGNIATAIPDNGSIDIPILVTDVFTLSDVNFKLRINHTFDADLDISLIHPDNTIVDLTSDNGGGSDNYGSGANDCSGTYTIFDDAAATAITAGAAPFAGTFRPEGLLSVFNGKMSNGTWKLRVTDDAGLDVGTIGCFELGLSETQCCAAILSASTVTITSDDCNGNGAIDPNEMITVSLGIQNTGTVSTLNLVGTLQPTGGVTNPSAPQNYGAVINGGSAVFQSFSFTASDFVCGQPIVLTLRLQDGAKDYGIISYNFSTGQPATTSTTYSSGNIAVPIPDNGSVDIPVNIPDVFAISDVNVSVRLNHTFDGDIEMSLVHPDNTSVLLVNNRGGSGDNFGTGANDCSGTPTIFDSQAGTAITAGVVPFAGTFIPEATLTAFNGKLSNGNWILRVSDQAGLDVGTVGCFQLELKGTICCTPQLEAGGTLLGNESCSPGNDAIDPYETVTVSFCVQNTGSKNTTDLVGTLQLSGGITNITTGVQNYGVVAYGGSSACRDFTFDAPAGTCGGSFTASVQFQDMAEDLGTFDYIFTLGEETGSNTSYSNLSAITLPSGAPGTTSGPASPYPSNINVAGAIGQISKVTVSLNNYNHTFPDDIDVLLVSPAGQKVILMSDAGGSTDAVGVNLTFDDAAATGIPDGGPVASGTFKPTEFSGGDIYNAPAPAGPYSTTLAAFNGVSPNGTWSLYIMDDAGGDVGNFNGGWELNIQTTEYVCCVDPCQPDITDPNAVCQDITVYLDNTGNISITAEDIDDGSNDGCGPVTLSASKTSFDCNDLGLNIVQLTVEDESGNTDDCLANVTVLDIIPPSITCPIGLQVIGNDISDAPAAYADIFEWAGAGGNGVENCFINNASFVLQSEILTSNVACTKIYTRTYYVEDESGNSATCEQTVTVTSSLATTATATSDYNGYNVSCLGGSDGEATANPSGGLQPYSYEWSDGQTTQTATGLNAGTHEVTVTDAAGCTATADVTLSQPPKLNLTVEATSDFNGYDVQCFGGSNGEATGTPSGGVPGYSYEWSDGQTINPATGLSADTYELTVTDANLCTVSASIILTEPPQMTIDAGENQLVYYGYDDSACATLTAEGAGGGVPPYDYGWSNGSPLHTTNVCPQTSTVYYVTLTDQNGCTVVDSVKVCAIDVRCGHHLEKVTICHETGSGTQTLCIAKIAAKNHLRTHSGDQLAACGTLKVCSFTPPSAKSDEEVPYLFNHESMGETWLRAFPNPFAENTEVRFILPEDGRVSLKIYDITGKEIFLLFEGSVTSGTINHSTFNGSNYASGIYFLTLTNLKGEKFVEKLVLTD